MALYEKMPTAAELEAHGLTLEDFEGDEVEVWPENWQAFQLFCRMQTQWRGGGMGATGLCYESLYPLLDRMSLSKKEWDEMFEDVRAMEFAALEAKSGNG